VKSCDIHPEPLRRKGRFHTGMAAAYNDDVKGFHHKNL
jgi:hypothetical protein